MPTDAHTSTHAYNDQLKRLVAEFFENNMTLANSVIDNTRSNSCGIGIYKDK